MLRVEGACLLTTVASTGVTAGDNREKRESTGADLLQNGVMRSDNWRNAQRLHYSSLQQN